MTIYGYARVSTNGQDLAAQEAELKAAGAAKVFKEKVSGAKTDRAELAKVIRRLGPGDVLVVTRLDRLARSTRDLLNVLATIGERQGGFRSLKDAWADTTTPHGRLMLTVLGGLAEFERELIHARTSDGRARAKARGVRFGRPAALTPTNGRKRSSGSSKALHRPILRGPTACRRQQYRDLRPPDTARVVNALLSLEHQLPRSVTDSVEAFDHHIMRLYRLSNISVGRSVVLHLLQ